MGTIIIRALAGGALAGTTDRHPLAQQQVPPIGSAPDFAGDVARAKQLEPLVKEGCRRQPHRTRRALRDLASERVDDAGRLLDAAVISKRRSRR